MLHRTVLGKNPREIGLRKAVGARSRDVSRQFLAEAVALTLFGGAAGVALGAGTSIAVRLAGVVQTSVSLSSILLAFGVSAGIGILFGWYPSAPRRETEPHRSAAV